jgi:hypothetical protein
MGWQLTVRHTLICDYIRSFRLGCFSDGCQGCMHSALQPEHSGTVWIYIPVSYQKCLNGLGRYDIRSCICSIVADIDISSNQMWRDLRTGIYCVSWRRLEPVLALLHLVSCLGTSDCSLISLSQWSSGHLRRCIQNLKRLTMQVSHKPRSCTVLRDWISINSQLESVLEEAHIYID